MMNFLSMALAALLLAGRLLGTLSDTHSDVGHDEDLRPDLHIERHADIPDTHHASHSDDHPSAPPGSVGTRPRVAPGPTGMGAGSGVGSGERVMVRSQNLVGCPDPFRCSTGITNWFRQNQDRKRQVEDLKETTSELQEEMRNHRHRVKSLEMQGDELVGVDSLLRSLQLHQGEVDTLLHVHAALLQQLQLQLRNLSSSVKQVQRSPSCMVNILRSAALLGLKGAPAPEVHYASNCPTDCASLYVNGVRRSGVYSVLPSMSERPLPVYCDMETDGGGWTVVQRRTDGSVSFNRGWTEYSLGFGDLEGDHWLGNQPLHVLTKHKHYTLRIDLEDWTHVHKHATYTSFSIEDEQQRYRLHVAGFGSGVSLQDSFSWYHDGQPFSSPDTGNVCAEISHSGWWFNQCYYANLNGVYYKGGRYSSKAQNLLGPDGIVWFSWRDSDYYSLKSVSMMIRPRSFRTRLSP